MAGKLLKQYKVRYLSADVDGFSLEQTDDNSKVLLVDDLHRMDSDADKATLCEMIRTQKDKHFVLLSRGGVPGWLMPFQFSGVLESFDMGDLMLDKNSIQQLAAAYGATLTNSEIGAILKDTKGYPVALALRGLFILPAL